MEAAHGPDHPDVASVLSHFAALLHEQVNQCFTCYVVVVVVLTLTHGYNAVRGHRTGPNNSGAEDVVPVSGTCCTVPSVRSAYQADGI